MSNQRKKQQITRVEKIKKNKWKPARTPNNDAETNQKSKPTEPITTNNNHNKESTTTTTTIHQHNNQPNESMNNKAKK